MCCPAAAFKTFKKATTTAATAATAAAHALHFSQKLDKSVTCP